MDEAAWVKASLMFVAGQSNYKPDNVAEFINRRSKREFLLYMRSRFTFITRQYRKMELIKLFINSSQDEKQLLLIDFPLMIIGRTSDCHALKINAPKASKTGAWKATQHNIYTINSILSKLAEGNHAHN